MFSSACKSLLPCCSPSAVAWAGGAGQLGLGLFALSWLGLLYLHCKSMDTATVLEAALQEGLGEDYRSEIPPSRQQVLRAGIVSAEWLRPFSMKRPGVSLHRNLSYAGDGEDFGERNLLDVYQPQTPREGGFPILLQVHGGAWVIGNKEQQALPLMYHLAQRGWLCVSCNYRLSPKHTFPAHIIDVKRANRLGFASMPPSTAATPLSWRLPGVPPADTCPRWRR